MYIDRLLRCLVIELRVSVGLYPPHNVYSNQIFDLPRIVLWKEGFNPTTSKRLLVPIGTGLDVA